MHLPLLPVPQGQAQLDQLDCLGGMRWPLPFLYLAPLRAIVRGGQEPKNDPLKQPPIWLTFMAFSGLLTPCHMPSGTQRLSANHFSFVTLQINLLPSRLQLAKNAKTRLNINLFSFLNFSFFSMSKKMWWMMKGEWEQNGSQSDFPWRTALNSDQAEFPPCFCPFSPSQSSDSGGLSTARPDPTQWVPILSCVCMHDKLL